MKNAYLIMAHHNFSQLNTLLRLLDDRDNDIYVHIDAKAAAPSSDVITEGIKSSSIFFLPRISVYWGGDTQIQCELGLLKEAIRRHHDYYHLLSGDDLPIKTNEQIASYLNAHSGTEFVGISTVGTKQSMGRNMLRRMCYWYPYQNSNKSKSLTAWVNLFRQVMRGTDRLKDYKDRIAKGCQWFSITEQFAYYVLENETHIWNLFRDTQCCDELFMQTLLVNSPFKSNVIPNKDDCAMALRLIDWNRSNGRSPWTFRDEDYPRIINSPCLFARKFDSSVDSQIVDHIVAFLLNRNLPKNKDWGSL